MQSPAFTRAAGRTPHSPELCIAGATSVGRRAGRRRGVREGRDVGWSRRATRPAPIRFGLCPRHRRDGDGSRRSIGARSPSMDESRRSGGSRLAPRYVARGSSRIRSRLPAPRGPERSGSSRRHPAHPGAGAATHCQAWFRGRSQSGREAACKGERTAVRVPGRAQKRSGRHTSAWRAEDSGV